MYAEDTVIWKFDRARRIHFQATNVSVGRRPELLWYEPLQITSPILAAGFPQSAWFEQREKEWERRKFQYLLWSMVSRVTGYHFFISALFYWTYGPNLTYCWRLVKCLWWIQGLPCFLPDVWYLAIIFGVHNSFGVNSHIGVKKVSLLYITYIENIFSEYVSFNLIYNVFFFCHKSCFKKCVPLPWPALLSWKGCELNSWSGQGGYKKATNWCLSLYLSSLLPPL